MNTLRSSAVWFSVNVTLLVMYLALASPPLLPVSFVDTLLIKLLMVSALETIKTLHSSSSN